MQIQPWHIPLIAMTAVSLPPSVWWLIGWFRATTGGTSTPPTPDQARRERLRTRILAVLTLVLLVLCVVAVGPATASLIATAATAVSTVISAALTVQSFLFWQEIRNQNSDSGNDSAAE